MEPISSVNAIYSSIKIFEIVYQLKAVGEQTADLLSTIDHVNHNVHEARRLRRHKATLLSSSEQIWMDKVIDDTVVALQSVAQLIEPARVDSTTEKSVTLCNKFLWVLRDGPKVKDKHARLAICHQFLTAVIACLYAREPIVLTPVIEKPEDGQPPPLYNIQIEQFFEWQNQRKRRKSYLGIRDEQDRRTAALTGTGPIAELDVNVPGIVAHPHELDAEFEVSTTTTEYESNSRYHTWDQRFKASTSNEAAMAHYRTSTTYFTSTPGLNAACMVPSHTNPDSSKGIEYRGLRLGARASEPKSEPMNVEALKVYQPPQQYIAYRPNLHSASKPITGTEMPPVQAQLSVRRRKWNELRAAMSGERAETREYRTIQAPFVPTAHSLSGIKS